MKGRYSELTHLEQKKKEEIYYAEHDYEPASEFTLLMGKSCQNQASINPVFTAGEGFPSTAMDVGSGPQVPSS